MMLQIESLEFSVGEFYLGPLSFELEKGGYLAISGPSGSGKSVLMELVAGLRRVKNGKIIIDSINHTYTPSRERPVGLLFQDYALFPHLTVYDNIAFPLKILKKDHLTIKSRVTDLAEYFSIENLLGRDIDTLSGGERQRAALARAIAYEPSILILDEPLSALDEELRDEAKRTLAGLKNSGQTIIHVTHNRNEVDGLASKSIILSHGFIKSEF
ncbi:MAG: ATP-binding cassette domain-containing protein [Bacteroidales bacterium]|jgi:ABC-type sugar transport system ATPase subunit